MSKQENFILAYILIVFCNKLVYNIKVFIFQGVLNLSYYFKVLKNYVNFSGRARRSEYWYFFLFNVIISTVLSFLGLTSINLIYSLAVLLPGIAVAIRRMHDVNKSGWFVLIPFYNIYLACSNSTQGENSYGANPKAAY